MATTGIQQVILSGTQLNDEVAGLLNEITFGTPIESRGEPLVWLVPDALAKRVAKVLDDYVFPGRPLAKTIMRIDPKRLAAEVRALEPEYEDGELVGYLFSHYLVSRIHCLATARTRPKVTFLDIPAVADDELFEVIDKAALKLPG
jgi:hypothetical protein